MSVMDSNIWLRFGLRWGSIGEYHWWERRGYVPIGVRCEIGFINRSSETESSHSEADLCDPDRDVGLCEGRYDDFLVLYV